RGTSDQVALAEKLMHDLDKPLAEVVVDVIVFEANRSRTRDLASSIISGGASGITLPISFTPRGGGSTVPSDNGGDNGDSNVGSSVRLGNLGKLGWNDWSVSLPGYLLSALMTDNTTKILQRPQLRAADGQKASLKLGDRIPFATGSFQPGVGAVGVSPLVSTQFQYADVGVNVDLTPKIHGAEDISMHIEIEISAVKGSVDLGGLEQPIIGQRKVVEDIRVKDSEVTLLGGLSQDQNTKTEAGVPGLSKIPIIKWLGFGNDSKERSESELLIALIPHIVRRPEISELNLRGVAAGSDQVVRLTYASNGTDEEPAKPAEPKPQAPKPAAEAAEPDTPPIAESEEPEPPKPAGQALIRFDPATVATQRGAVFSVSLLIDNATDIFN
ncbi:MAG: type II and III secretion system protein, partial [bacterium]|nr:type II and III secretion system protein [bacterium]